MPVEPHGITSHPIFPALTYVIPTMLLYINCPLKYLETIDFQMNASAVRRYPRSDQTFLLVLFEERKGGDFFKRYFRNFETDFIMREVYIEFM